MNSVAYLPQSKRLLDQVSEVLRYKHYSLKTEQAYLYWIRFFVRYQTFPCRYPCIRWAIQMCPPP